MVETERKSQRQRQIQIILGVKTAEKKDFGQSLRSRLLPVGNVSELGRQGKGGFGDHRGCFIKRKKHSLFFLFLGENIWI
jgi:hypothetical protein